MVASLSTSLRCHDKDKTPEMSHPEASILRLEQAPPTRGECLVTWLWDLVAAAHPVLLVSPHWGAGATRCQPTFLGDRSCARPPTIAVSSPISPRVRALRNIKLLENRHSSTAGLSQPLGEFPYWV